MTPPCPPLRVAGIELKYGGFDPVSAELSDDPLAEFVEELAVSELTATLDPALPWASTVPWLSASFRGFGKQGPIGCGR